MGGTACEGHQPAGRLEPRPGEAIDLGRATATGRVFPLYTCQKKHVIQWMALSHYPEGFKSPLILNPIYFRNSTGPPSWDGSQGVAFQGSCSVEGTDHGKVDKEQGKHLLSGLQFSPQDWRDLLCARIVLQISVIDNIR